MNINLSSYDLKKQKWLSDTPKLAIFNKDDLVLACKLLKEYKNSYTNSFYEIRKLKLVMVCIVKKQELALRRI